MEETISIEGTLLMLDDVTPHVAVPVQAIRDGEVIATVLSDERGRYRFISLKPGWYQVRCQVLGGYVYYGKEKAGKPEGRGIGGFLVSPSAHEPMSLQVEGDKTLSNIDFRFAPLKKGRWENYRYLDGLAAGYVRGIYCDPDGVMWFATTGGASRYDGKEFVNFTEKDGLAGHVNTIYRDPDGVMWFGTWGSGIHRYDGNEFVNFTMEDGLAGEAVFDIHRDPDGVMWFATRDGVSRYDGRMFVNFTTADGLAHERVNAIHRDTDGAMWFGTEGGGVSCYDGKTFVSLTTEDGLGHNSVNAIHRDPDGVLWFGTGDWSSGGGGLARYDGKEFVNLTTEDGLVYDCVKAIHQDSDGVMWLATRGGGVSRYDGKTFVNLTTEDGLTHNWVNAVCPDPDGAIWFGTEGGGISRYDEKTFVNFTTKDGFVDNSVNAIHRDPDGVMWFGTGDWLSRRSTGGVVRYDGKEIVNLTTKDGLASCCVNTIYRGTDDVMWFGTTGGVSRYDVRGMGDFPHFVNFTIDDGLAYKCVSGIYRDPDGMMWFATGDWWGGGGVFRYDGEEFVNFTTKDGLAHNRIVATYTDPDGTMWFGTRGGGVSRFDGKEFINFTAEDGLPGNEIWGIYRDADGALWFSGDGVSRYDGKQFTKFSEEDGLASNIVGAIYQDSSGVLWFGTSGAGVSAYDGAAWTSLDTRDGLASDIVDSIFQDPDGFLWFGTEYGGVTRYRPGTTPPKVHIISVTTDQTYGFRAQDPRLRIEDSIIPAFTIGTRVTIEYDAIDFKTLLEKRQYRIRIREIDSNWRKPTRAPSFDFIFDEPGTYTFEVQAIDRDLNYSEPASVELEVIADPRNHQIAQLESDLEKRNRELEEANVELQRLSSFKSELLSVVSHELRTPLTSIDGFTRLISERFLTDELIEKISEDVRPTIQRAKDRIGIVQENTSRLARLINDLLDFSRIERGRELEMSLARIELSDVIETVINTYQSPAAEKGLSLKYGGDVPLHADQLVVYGDADRLNQALSNLVGNAVKFTPAGGEITIGAHKMDGKIQLTVKDTGVGIPEEQLATIFEPFEQAGGVDSRRSGTGLGLSIVKYIIIRHDGTIHVESEEGAGSTFIITLSEYTPEAPTRRGLQRILIVDDDYDILRLLEEGLSEYPNTHIITAASSKDAFQILEQQSCDVMITDVRMPGDLSGIELASQVREKYPDLKVFVMTNTPDGKERVIHTEADWIDKATPNLIHYIAKKIGRESA